MAKIRKDLAAMFDLVFLHKDFDENTFSDVEDQDINIVKNLATKEARKLYEMQRSVMRCIHLKKSFIRFSLSRHGILYTRTHLEHNVVEQLLEHFNARYPLFHIAIEYDKKTYVISPEGKISVHGLRVEEAVRMLEAELMLDPILTEIEFDDGLWEEYYDSQYIRQRRNTGLMKKMMPLKYRSDDQEETRIAKRSRDLGEWC